MHMPTCVHICLYVHLFMHMLVHVNVHIVSTFICMSVCTSLSVHVHMLNVLVHRVILKHCEVLYILLVFVRMCLFIWCNLVWMGYKNILNMY
jgi:hypothetical protein